MHGDKEWKPCLTLRKRNTGCFLLFSFYCYLTHFIIQWIFHSCDGGQHIVVWLLGVNYLPLASYTGQLSPLRLVLHWFMLTWREQLIAYSEGGSTWKVEARECWKFPDREWDWTVRPGLKGMFLNPSTKARSHKPFWESACIKSDSVAWLVDD